MTRTEILSLIKENRFLLYGQPKWTVGKNTCNTYEVFVEKALMPDNSEIPARDIVKQIEADEELTELYSNWFLNAALKSAQDLNRKTNVHLTVSMDLFPLYCNRYDFIYRVQQALKAASFSPEKLQFELTESQSLTETGIENLNRLHDELGVGLWLDHFGTGYSNLALINKVHIDGVEMDRCFAADCLKSERAAKLLVAIAHFADTLDIKVCAKGVETEDQMQFFEDYGYFKVQGYFISMPMKLSELETYINNYAVHARNES